MNWKIAQTLWDLLAPHKEKPRDRPAAASDNGNANPQRKLQSTSDVVVVASAARRPPRKPMQVRYDALVVEMKKRYGIRVRKWRKSSSGCAWEVHYSTGSIARLIESPYPRGPMSCAIFLHEIGHHAIGFRTYRPRCLEEYHAWKWSLDTMRAYGFNVTDAVQKRMEDSLRYAVSKARRRGLRDVPPELVRYVD